MAVMRRQWIMLLGRRRHGATSVRVKSVSKLKSLDWRRYLRWLKVALAMLAIVLGLAAATQKVLDPALFPLEHVHLKGEFRNLEEPDLQRRVDAFLGRNFFALDTGVLRRMLLAEPWIEWVALQREWPDRVVVRFRERIAFGRWGQDEMVDVNGVRFRPAAIRQPGPWPHLVGPDGSEKILLRRYRETSAMLAEIGLKVERLTLDERWAWSMTFDSGLELNLGRDLFAERLQRFMEIYPEVLSEQIAEISAVDLRYVNGFAVRWN